MHVRNPAAILLSSVLLFSCKETPVEIAPQPQTLLPVSHLSAYSAGATSVGLAWTASPDTGLDGMQGHLIRTRLFSNQDTVGEEFADKHATSIIVDSLLEGAVYVFEVIVRGREADSVVLDSE